MSVNKKILSFIIILLLCNFTNSIVDRTFFTYLGLPITASQQQVVKAYQQKKLKVESIENQQQKQRKLKLLETAYSALGNQKQRQKYQRYGKDIYKTIKQITSINQYTNADSRKGPTMNLKIPVSIQDLYNGTTVKALFQTKQACSKCMGSGAQSPKHLKTCGSCGGKGFQLIDGRNRFGQPQRFQGICSQCHGSGKKVQKSCQVCQNKKIVEKLKQIDIKIPAKFQGKQLKLKNYGPEQNLGAPSDFLVQIEQIPSLQWRRIGDNLHYTLEITLQQSIFGFKKTFTHLSGQQIVVERNEQTTKQTKISMPEKGFTNKGKLQIQFKILIPNFTDRQLDMWEDFFNKYKI